MGRHAMFTSIHLKNFKSWQDTGEVALAPITLLFGSNSSGKTSILQSLLLMKQTMESADRSRPLELGGTNSLVDLGTYSDIVFNHSDSADVKFSVRWQARDALTITDELLRAQRKGSVLERSDNLSLTTVLKVANNDAEVERVTYELGGTRFDLARRVGKKGFDLTSNVYTFARGQGRAWPLPPPSKFYGLPDQVRLYFQNAGFLSDLELEAEREFSRIRYLGPLRDNPRRQYLYSGGRPADIGTRGELAIEALIASGHANAKASRGWQAGPNRKRLRAVPVERLIAEWLEELNLIHSFKLKALDERNTVYQVLVKRSANSPEVSLTDVGFGVSQILPILVLLATSVEGDIIILEQPEIHLHPAVQSKLADILIETALTHNVQIMAESHSEHLLGRIQRRLAEKNLKRRVVFEPKDVAMYFCEQKSGKSEIRRLQTNEYGNILNWPIDFFGNPLEDSVAAMTAAADRSS